MLPRLLPALAGAVSRRCGGDRPATRPRPTRLSYPSRVVAPVALVSSWLVARGCPRCRRGVCVGVVVLPLLPPAFRPRFLKSVVEPRGAPRCRKKRESFLPSAHRVNFFSFFFFLNPGLSFRCIVLPFHPHPPTLPRPSSARMSRARPAAERRSEGAGLARDMRAEVGALPPQGAVVYVNVNS